MDVLVVGGGIGGLSAALALARAGVPVRVLERAAQFAELGAGLQLAPNATRVLARLGVLDQVLAAGILPRRLVLRSAVTADELTALDLAETFGDRYRAPYVVLHRSDLLTILHDACTNHGVAPRRGPATRRAVPPPSRRRLHPRGLAVRLTAARVTLPPHHRR